MMELKTSIESRTVAILVGISVLLVWQALSPGTYDAVVSSPAQSVIGWL
jgi:hypothetical protein